MSDLYLELRSRIPVVAAKTHVGSARLQESQDAKGLSNERIARLVPVSEKTWRRWKAAGEIPTAALPAVAKVLGLEIRGHAPEPLDVGPATEYLSPRELRQVVREEVEAALAPLELLLQRLLDQEPPESQEGDAEGR